MRRMANISVARLFSLSLECESMHLKPTHNHISIIKFQKCLHYLLYTVCQMSSFMKSLIGKCHGYRQAH